MVWTQQAESFPLRFPSAHRLVVGGVPEFGPFGEEFNTHFFDAGVGDFFELFVERVMGGFVRVVVFGIVATEERSAGIG